MLGLGLSTGWHSGQWNVRGDYWEAAGKCFIFLQGRHKGGRVPPCFQGVLSCLSVMPGNLPASLQPCEELRARQRGRAKGWKGWRLRAPAFFKPVLSDLSSSCWVGVLVCQGCHNKVTQTGWLKQMGIYFLTALEAWSLGSKCQQGWSFWGLSPWLADSTLSPCPHMVFPCTCLSQSPLLIKTPVTRDQGLPQRPHFSPASHLFKGPTSKYSHILRCWGLGFGAGANSVPNSGVRKHPYFF